MNRKVIETLSSLQDKILNFRSGDLCFVDQSDKRYDRWHIEYLVDLGFIKREFNISKLVWEWKLK